MSSWKESLSREYRDTGAPERIGKWVLLGIGGYLVFKMLGSTAKASENIGEGIKQVSEGVKQITKIFLPAPEKMLPAFEVAYPQVLARGVQPTLSPAQLAIEAENLEDAFKTMFTLTEDADAILASFAKVKNDADFINLFLAFGTRSFVFGLNEGNLLEWINRWESDLKPDINRLLERNAGSELRL